MFFHPNSTFLEKGKGGPFQASLHDTQAMHTICIDVLNESFFILHVSGKIMANTRDLHIIRISVLG